MSEKAQKQENDVFGPFWWVVRTYPALLSWLAVTVFALDLNRWVWPLEPAWDGLINMAVLFVVLWLGSRLIRPLRRLLPWGDFVSGRGVNTRIEADPADRKLARHIAKTWPTVAERAQLTAPDPRKRDRVRSPRLSRIGSTPLGLELSVTMPHGLTCDDLAHAAGFLASEWRVNSVRVQAVSAFEARVSVPLRDPLAGKRSVVVGPGRLAPIRIGRLASGDDAFLDLSDASHVAIQGMTRSGKSVFTYGVLSQVATMPEVRLFGVDPNSVLLAPWVSRCQQGDIALGSDPVAARAVIDHVVAHLDDRLYKLVERGIEKMTTFSPAEPLMVVVLEEFPALIRAAEDYDAGQKPADRITARIRGAVGRLVSEGAKVGIRVILITQRADASILDGATRAQMGTRLTFAVDNRDAVAMLHPEADAETIAEVRGFPPGRALLWQHRREAVMQADYIEYSDYRAAVGHV